MEGDFLHELAQGVSYLGNPVYWFAVIAAVLIAGITGMIPGASGILIMALSIPFIVQYFYGEQRAIGLVMLATMTGVNNTLDSIPAVLLGQPGAATQVTFLEGHQLARQGKAAHTLGAIYAVSAFGGLVGAVVLAMLVPVIKPFILGFGFAEIAAMAFFGIAMVSALSAGAMVKGLAAGAFGVLLGTVGPAVVGEVRFVFQQPILWDRLPIIAVTLGFFALPEMIDLSIARRPVAPSSSVITNKEVWRGARDGMKRWKVMIRQSIFGVLMGAIPGVGAAVIDWLSYAFGIFWSKDKSQFGKGSLDGVLFAESAQNSKEAGQAIPTLALGVPGGLAWLFVLVAMISLDLTPGPRMLGAEADVVILLVVTLAIGNFMIAMLGLVATGQLAKLTRIPYPLIGGVIIPISFLTGIITMTSWLALPIMLVFIGIGVIMKIYQWPRPPLLLGIILGPIIERNFLSALNLHGPVGVATRPITIAVIVLAIATAYVFARSAQRRKAADAAEPTIAGASGTESQISLLRAVMDFRNLPVLLAVGGSLAFIAASLGFPEWETWLLPRTMGVAVIILALIQLFFHLREREHRHAEIMDLGMHSLALPGAKQAILLIAIAFLLLVLLAGTVGLRWGVIAFAGYLPFSLMASSSMGGARASLIGVVTAVVLAGCLIGGVFAWITEVMLPLSTEESATGWADGITTGVGVGAAVALAFRVNAQGVGKVTYPGPVAIVALTASVMVLMLTTSGWLESSLAWVYRIVPSLSPMLLLFLRPVRAFQPPPNLNWLFSWRVLASVITTMLVALFALVMADNVLFIIWPEPSLFEWIGREVFGEG